MVMYGCESWTVKKAEHRRMDAFELWCWRRFLRVPWTARRSNQSILKKISPRCSLEGLMLKLKLQYCGHVMGRIDSWEKTLILGKGWRPWCWRQEKGMTEDEMVGWHHRLNGHGFRWILGVGDGQGGLMFCGSWGRKELDMTEWLKWTEVCDNNYFRLWWLALSKNFLPSLSSHLLFLFMERNTIKMISNWNA